MAEDGGLFLFYFLFGRSEVSGWRSRRRCRKLCRQLVCLAVIVFALRIAEEIVYREQNGVLQAACNCAVDNPAWDNGIGKEVLKTKAGASLLDSVLHFLE